jgi:hypothetical protein
MAITMIVLAGDFAVAATEKSAVEGRWEGKLHTGNGDATMTFNFKVKGQVLTGTAETPRGSQTIDDGKVNGNNISFNTTINGNVIKHQGTLSGDTIQLQNAGPFGRFDVVLKRVSTSEKKSVQQ